MRHCEGRNETLDLTWYRWFGSRIKDNGLRAYRNSPAGKLEKLSAELRAKKGGKVRKIIEPMHNFGDGHHRELEKINRRDLSPTTGGGANDGRVMTFEEATRREKLRGQFHRLRQGTRSVREFQYELEYLEKELGDLSERTKVYKLWNGCRREYRARLRYDFLNPEFSTYEVVLDALIRYEEISLCLSMDNEKSESELRESRVCTQSSDVMLMGIT